MRRALLVFGLLLVAAPLACSGLVDPQPTPPGTPAGTASTGNPAGSSTGSPPPTATVGPTPQACGAVEPTQPATFTSQADVLSRLAGVWRTCQAGPLPPGTVGGPAGFEVLPDGHYYALGFDTSGSVVRLTGFEHEGKLTYVQGQSGPDITYGDVGFNPLDLQLSADGTTMSIYTEAGPSGPYVASAEAVAVRPTEPAGAREGAAGCKTLETGILSPPASTDEAIARVAGTWSLCPSTDPGNSRPLGPAGTVGVAFDPSGTWAFLVAAPDGTPVPSTDPGAHGTYAFEQNGTSLDGSLDWQLNMQQGDGTFAFLFEMSSSPVKLMVLDEGGAAVLSAN